MKIAVFGSGSFGLALGFKVASNGHEVRLICRKQEDVDAINSTRRHPRYLTNANYELPPNMNATTSTEEALDGAQFVIHCVPVQASSAFLEANKHLIPPNLTIINASKGISTDTLEYMSQIIPRALGRNQPTAFLSGPSFAKELMECQPTAVVVASEDIEVANAVQGLFTGPSLRVYVTTDVIGVEIGGALKNVFAIGCGICVGLELGFNSMTAFVTRGIAEMTRLAIAMGANPHTLSGLSGIGDLMLTCFGSLSRNRSVGVRLGKGESMAEISASLSEVAEGVATALAAVKLAEKLQLDLPIVMTVAAVISGERTPKEAVFELMARPASHEIPAELRFDGTPKEHHA